MAGHLAKASVAAFLCALLLATASECRPVAPQGDADEVLSGSLRDLKLFRDSDRPQIDACNAHHKAIRCGKKVEMDGVDFAYCANLWNFIVDVGQSSKSNGPLACEC